jgi:hypothetical protein
MSEEPQSPGTPEAPEAPEWVKTLKWLAHHFVHEGEVIWKAPIATLFAWALMTYASYLYLNSRFSEQMENLHSANDTRQATIQFQNQRIADLQDRVKNNSTSQVVPPTTSVTPVKEENKYVCTITIAAKTAGRQDILIEFGVHDQSTNGLVVYVGLSGKYSLVEHWEGQPLRTDVPANESGVYMDYAENKQDTSFTMRFSTPNVTKQKSEYVYIESEKSIIIQKIFYLEDVFLLSDPLRVDKAAAHFSSCPR